MLSNESLADTIFVMLQTYFNRYRLSVSRMSLLTHVSGQNKVTRLNSKSLLISEINILQTFLDNCLWDIRVIKTWTPDRSIRKFIHVLLFMGICSLKFKSFGIGYVSDLSNDDTVLHVTLKLLFCPEMWYS